VSAEGTDIAPPLEVARRIDRLRPLFADAQVDALLVTTAANVRYLTGFTGSAGLVLVTEDNALLVTDGRYRTQADEQLDAAGTATTVDVAIGGVQKQRDALAALVGGADARRLGLESDDVTWGAQRRWAEVMAPAELVATTTLVDFRALDEALLQWYLAGDEWRQRAGGYAIQGRGAALVAGIEGDYSNVVGLPVVTLLELVPRLLTDTAPAG